MCQGLSVTSLSQAELHMFFFSALSPVLFDHELVESLNGSKTQ